MRHGRAIKPETLTTFRLHADGIAAATEVGGALAEVLDDLRKAGTPVGLVRVLHEKSPACRATVLTLSDAYHGTCRALESSQGSSPPKLPPPEPLEAPVSPYEGTPQGWVEKTKGKLTELVVPDKHEGAVLIVGHDPGMNWLLQSLMQGSRPWRRRWLASVIPGLDRAELIALYRCPGGWTPRWALTPNAGTTEALAEITGKIRSKMDTAKVLGGFFTALLTFAATQSVQDLEQKPALSVALLGISLTLLAAGSALYMMTLFWYDRLLMPLRFWSSSPEGTRGPTGMLTRPPSSAVWVLYQNMQRTWRRLFVPATWSTGLGVVCFVIAQLEPPPERFWAVALAVVLLAATICWGWLWRPSLGVKD